MPATNVKMHTPASKSRVDFFKFHLSVKNRHAAIYTIDIPDEIVIPCNAKEEKSNLSNSNNSSDQTALGRYKAATSNPVGNILANKTNKNSHENIMPIRGTNMQFKRSDHPDT